jgi:hypothetical protein
LDNQASGRSLRLSRPGSPAGVAYRGVDDLSALPADPPSAVTDQTVGRQSR